jgi:hypothetical protein
MTAMSQSMLQTGPETALESALARAGLDAGITPSGAADMPWGHMTIPRATVAFASAVDRADPPIMTFQALRSTLSMMGIASSTCRIVGTQCEKVTPSS